MFRTKRPDPFAGIYEEASRREQQKRGTFLTQVVRSGGESSFPRVSERTERTPTITSSRSTRSSRKPASSLGEFSSPFRVQEHEREAQARRLQRYPTVSANSAFTKAHPKELGYRTIDHKTRRAKDIQFPVFLRNNEVRQDKLLTDLEIRERRLAHIKSTQIVHDYTDEGKKKRRAKKVSGAKGAEKTAKPLPKSSSVKVPLKSALKSSQKGASQSSVKSRSKSNDDELETLPDDELGSQYTFETLPDGASYDYLIETEEVPPGATHGTISTKPVKLVRKGGEAADGENFSFEAPSPKPEATESAPVSAREQETTEEHGSKDLASEDASTRPLKEGDTKKSGLESKVKEQADNALDETIGNKIPGGIGSGAESNLTRKAAESKVGSTSRDILPDGDAEKVQDVLGSSDAPKETKEAVEKTTRFKEGAEKIPDKVIGDETLEIAPQTGALGAGVAAADITKESEKPKDVREPEATSEVVQAPELDFKEPQDDQEGFVDNESTPGSMVDDVHSEVSITSPPVDHTTVPRVVAFPEVEKKGPRLSLFRRKDKTRMVNPLATPQDPEMIVKTDREGFLTKAVYDKTKYDNRQHAEWLTEFIKSEKKKCEQTQLDYDNKLADLKKEVERLEEVMQEVKDDADELIEIRHNRLSKKFLDETQRYVERKNAIFIETRAIQEQKEKETEEVRLKHEQVQKEIDDLNAEKDTAHREYIGWTNRLADLSSHLDARMFGLITLQQKHLKTQNEIDALTQKRHVLEKEIAAHNDTHAENAKALESHANKKYLPQVHEIDDKISALLNELSIIKQESSNEKAKLGSISKKLDDERQAHDEQLKLEAEDRERREKDLLRKQREEHETSAAELKRRHEKEIKRIKRDYEKRLQEAREQPGFQDSGAEVPKTKDSEPLTSGAAGVGATAATSGATSGGTKSTGNAASNGVKSAGSAAADGVNSADTMAGEGVKSSGNTAGSAVKSTGKDTKGNIKSGGNVAKSGQKAAGSKATSGTSRNARNPFFNSPITKSGDTREFTGDPNKPSAVASNIPGFESDKPKVFEKKAGSDQIAPIEDKSGLGGLESVKDTTYKDVGSVGEKGKSTNSPKSTKKEKAGSKNLDPAENKARSGDLGRIHGKNKHSGLQPYEDNAKPGELSASENKKKSGTLDPYGDKAKSSGLVSPEDSYLVESNPVNYAAANDSKVREHYPLASRESSLFDYETEEEIRSL